MSSSVENRSKYPEARNRSLESLSKSVGVDTQKDLVEEVMRDRNMARRGPKEVTLKNELISGMKDLHGLDLEDFIRNRLKIRGLLAMTFFKCTPTSKTQETRRNYSGESGIKIFGNRDKLAEIIRNELDRKGIIGVGFELTSRDRYQGDLIIYSGELPKIKKDKDGNEVLDKEQVPKITMRYVVQ